MRETGREHSRCCPMPMNTIARVPYFSLFKLKMIQSPDRGLTRTSELESSAYAALRHMMYVPLLQVNRFKKFILPIAHLKYLKSCSRRFYCTNLILRTRLCGTFVIAQPSCDFDFHMTEICQVEMICIGDGVPVLKRHFGGAGP